MKTAVSTLVLFFLLLASRYTFSQQSNLTDSLINRLQSLAKSDTNRLPVLNRLSNIYLERNLDTALIFARELQALSELHDHPVFLVRTATLYGDIEYEKSNYDKALTYFRQALKLSLELPEKTNMSYLLGQMALTYGMKGEYSKAIEYLRRGEEVAIKKNDSTGMANISNSLGITYHKLGNYDRASQYYFKSLKLWDKVGDIDDQAVVLNNLGMVFVHQDEHARGLEYFQQAAAAHLKMGHQFDFATATVNIGLAYNGLGEYEKAMEAFNKARAIQEEYGHNYQLTITYLNIGYCLLDQKMYEEALEYFYKTLSIRKEIGSKSGIASALDALSECYLKMEQYDKAIKNAREALTYAEERGELGYARAATEYLAEAYSALGIFDKAYEFLALNKKYNDSTLNKQKTQLINNLRVEYEVNKKEQEIELLNASQKLQEAEIKQQKLVRNISLIAFLLLAAFGFILFRIYRLNQEKKQINIQAKLEKEKMEAERLQELDEAKSRFFANIAHEFRTPLTLILGPSEQIIEEYPDQQLQETAGLIRRNADKLLVLVNQMLDLSKLESGMVRLQPVNKDFISFTKGYIQGFESLAEEKEIGISLTSSLQNLEMDFDPEKCAIIFNNLMSNALKFTQPFGEVKILIQEEKNAASEDFVSIEVADTGAGISAEQLPYIFDRFYQVNDSTTRKTHGTGIGLALAKECTELHGGKISVSSRRGEGTAFKIVLPQRQENAMVAESGESVGADLSMLENPVENQNRTLSPASLSKKRDRVVGHTVLVVEDNAEVRKFITDIVGNFYHVIEAENGRQGLEIASCQIPDLIISDVMMPEIDGYEFCRQAKNDDKTSHIPVIMLTAKAGMESKLEGLDTGADDYLAKPFNARELLARIRNLIAVREKLQLKYLETRDSSLFAAKENQFLVKIKSVIEENIDKEEFGVEDLGKALAMSRTQVHRKLKALTNQSASQFVRQFKLEKALDLLKTADYNVSEVAYMTGFNSPNYFSTCFAEQFGYPPSELKGKKG